MQFITFILLPMYQNHILRLQFSNEILCLAAIRMSRKTFFKKNSIKEEKSKVKNAKNKPKTQK